MHHHNRTPHLLTISSLLAFGIVLALAGTTRAATIIDNDFTANPTANGWQVVQQNVPDSNSAATWDGSANFTTTVSGSTTLTGPTKTFGEGLVDNNTDEIVDMVHASQITQQVAFSAGSVHGPHRLLLLSDPATNDGQFSFGSPYLYVQMQNKHVQVFSKASSGGANNIFDQQAGSIDGSLTDAGDWIQVVYSRTKLESLIYYDASGNGGAGNTITLVSPLDNLAIGVDFTTDFANGGYTGLESVVFATAKNPTPDPTTTVWDRVTVEVTPLPEPGSLALLGVGGLTLLSRKRRGAEHG